MRLAAILLAMLLRMLLPILFPILGPMLSPLRASTFMPPRAAMLSPLLAPVLSSMSAPRLSSRLSSVLGRKLSPTLSWMVSWILMAMRRRSQNIGSRRRGPRPPRAESVAHTPDPDRSPCTQMHGREIWFRRARARTVKSSGFPPRTPALQVDPVSGCRRFRIFINRALWRGSMLVLPRKRPHCCGVANMTRCATSSRYFLMQRHRLRSNFWSGPGQTTAQGLACVRVDSSQAQFCVLSLAGGWQTRIHGDMRLCAWEGFGANARLATVTSRSAICFTIGPSGNPTRLRAKIACHREGRHPNRGKNLFHAQSCQSRCASVQRIGAPYLQTSRKKMPRPNDRHPVDADMVVTFLGADRTRQSRRPDRPRRIYFRSPWCEAIAGA